MGIINNEKYKGDILLGKTFTVDPISKRRLENLGEEDRYYIHNHHEPIITEEQFERAQEIRNRRNGNRKHNVIPGNVRSSADSLHLVVWWNVDFAVLIFHADAGIVVLNIKRQYGSVLSQRRKEKDFVLIVRVFRNR